MRTTTATPDPDHEAMMMQARHAYLVETRALEPAADLPSLHHALPGAKRWRLNRSWCCNCETDLTLRYLRRLIRRYGRRGAKRQLSGCSGGRPSPPSRRKRRPASRPKLSSWTSSFRRRRADWSQPRRPQRNAPGELARPGDVPGLGIGGAHPGSYESAVVPIEMEIP